MDDHALIGHLPAANAVAGAQADVMDTFLSHCAGQYRYRDRVGIRVYLRGICFGQIQRRRDGSEIESI